MNKTNVRAFSLGILFATIFFSCFLFFQEEEIEEPVQESEKSHETTAEIERLTDRITTLERENRKLQKTIRSLEEKTEQPAFEPVLIEIHAGMTNDDVVELLGAKNLIADDGMFKQFMIEHGYDRKIQVGTYILYPEMSHEAIAETITKSD